MEPLEALSKLSLDSLECSCCFSEMCVNESVTCTDNHLCCVMCLETGIGIAIAERKTVKCFSTVGCSKEYPEKALKRGLETGTKNAYDKIVALECIKTLPGFYKCPYCDNGGILDDSVSQYHCMDCDKSVCTKCSKDFHQGECAGEAKDDGFSIICTCGLRIIRGDGCNKLTCVCKKIYCWLCKQNIKDGYKHFVKGCELYGLRPDEDGYKPGPVLQQPRQLPVDVRNVNQLPVRVRIIQLPVRVIQLPVNRPPIEARNVFRLKQGYNEVLQVDAGPLKCRAIARTGTQCRNNRNNQHYCSVHRERIV